ncbi:hypothetical protein DRN74_07190, partial [Candidatus Micrarchaeota archaeon]
MKTNGTRYRPAFELQVVLEALKGRGGRRLRPRWPRPTGAPRHPGQVEAPLAGTRGRDVRGQARNVSRNWSQKWFRCKGAGLLEMLAY